MATQKIIVASIKNNDKWLNVTDSNNIEWGINKEKNPKLAALVATLQQGQEFTANTWEKDKGDGKIARMLFEPDEAKDGGKKFTPKVTSDADYMMSCITAACQAFSLTKDENKTKEKIAEWAEYFYTKVQEKKK